MNPGKWWLYRAYCGILLACLAILCCTGYHWYKMIFHTHQWQIDDYIKPTCQTEGEQTLICSVCGDRLTEAVPVVKCKAGEWQIVQEASDSAVGERVRFCTMCGRELNREAYADYVLNNNTKRFHYPSCPEVKKIAPKNAVTSSQNREKLISWGYTACGHCCP